jgi:hypothetical protein
MRTITCLFLILALALSFGIWKISFNAHLLRSRIEMAEEEIKRITRESQGLDKYKDEEGLALEKFYPEVFSDIRQICSYYQAPSEVKIIGAKDFVDIEEFFKESQYQGVRYVDILAQIDLKGQLDAYLISVLCKMVKNKPIEILGLNLEKDTLNLTLRLYGT